MEFGCYRVVRHVAVGIIGAAFPFVQQDPLRLLLRVWVPKRSVCRETVTPARNEVGVRARSTAPCWRLGHNFVIQRQQQRIEEGVRNRSLIGRRIRRRSRRKGRALVRRLRGGVPPDWCGLQ